MLKRKIALRETERTFEMGSILYTTRHGSLEDGCDIEKRRCLSDDDSNAKKSEKEIGVCACQKHERDLKRKSGVVK